jgi:hypothetical protein
MSDNLPTLEFPAAIVDLQYPLENFRKALGGKGPVRIVAMGSSSTAGLGNVVAYPARLELYLRKHYNKDDDLHKDIRIDVLNRGKGGEDAPQEVSRFKEDIFADDPSLVIWQVGTNAVFRKEQFNFDEVVEKIVEGLNLLCNHQAMDVILIDPQYVTAMLFDNTELSEKMVAAIRTAAQGAKVNLFKRWALMEYWHVHNNASLEQLLAPDDELKLHQSDWSTMHVARALRSAIFTATGVTRRCPCLITT